MITKADGLIQRFQNPIATIPYNFAQFEKFKFLNIKILKCVIKTIILCGKQCIALHGHRKEIHNNSKSCGNFRAILKLLSVIKFDLNHHLDAPSVGSASNISPRVQNEVTEIVSYDI